MKKEISLSFQFFCSSKLRSFLFVSFVLISLVVSISPSWAGLEADPKEIVITVVNVPVNEPSIFIPLSINSKELDFTQIQLKDIFIKGYLANIERDKNKNVLGISFSALRSKSLPDKLEAIIKVKSIRPAEASPKNYPKSVSIAWQAPWVFTKTTQKVAGGLAGFDGLSLAASDEEDLTRREFKQRRKEQENKANDFYIKSFGQPLVRGQRSSRSAKQETEFTQLPLLRELEFFVLTPPEGSYDKLYIPILIDNANLLEVNVMDSSLDQGTVLRVLENNLLEIVALNNGFLPNKSVVRGKINLKQSQKSLLNNVRLGSILSEPSRPLVGIGVSIVPNIITIKYSNWDPLNLF